MRRSSEHTESNGAAHGEGSESEGERGGMGVYSLQIVHEFMDPSTFCLLKN